MIMKLLAVSGVIGLAMMSDAMAQTVPSNMTDELKIELSDACLGDLKRLFPEYNDKQRAAICTCTFDYIQKNPDQAKYSAREWKVVAAIIREKTSSKIDPAKINPALTKDFTREQVDDFASTAAFYPMLLADSEEVGSCAEAKYKELNNTK